MKGQLQIYPLLHAWGVWTYWKSIDISPEELGTIGVAPTKEIIEVIERDGYYINDVSIKFNETDI